MWVNTRKAAGPDDISGQVLKTCANQRVSVHHNIQYSIFWILDFLTGRPQVVRVGRHTSRPLTVNTEHILSPLLYSLYTHDFVARFSSNTIGKFAIDTVVVGLISRNDEKACPEEDC